jgi:teichuronic acid biosynthesis glycosyltransferase TuaG
MELDNNMLISIVVPLYNYKKYIGYCIQSILNQTYKNFELIVVDDCSLDDSYEKAKKFEKKDSRIKVIKLKKNYGYSKAKNEGIVISRGEHIVTLDADDMMTKDSLEVRLKAALKYNVEFVYADAYLVKDNISLNKCYQTKKDRTNRSLNLYNIHAQTVLMHRDVYKKYGLYDEGLRSRSDREMWWRLFGKDKSENPKVSNYYVKKCVAYYRVHRWSMWRKRKRNPELDQKIIKMSEKAYQMRRKEGITQSNTRFLRDSRENL